ncbi:hypothetical protein H0H81_009879 [Sphagnurus paluster]|uniref:Uncharacterized protein n=1 Tax=Sphagnurus paluster TaxID=117069 RepID=A0A9P7K4F8_9AGAR|nr:hypothetical protein H0H81_009879 [Sphagnurus paluster]
MDYFAPETQAIYPLSLFDRLFDRTTFLTGWLVEGTIDSDALAVALANVTKKWRLLSGRLESMPNEDGETEWRIRVPLGEIPEDYETFSLTISSSENSLSHYVSLPLAPVSNSLPHTLFISPSTPRQFSAWQSTKQPITCWHITYLAADPSDGRKHTCIGFARSHGIFDGVGAGAIVRALVSEMRGEDWTAPAPPSSGFNDNPVRRALAAGVKAQIEQGEPDPENYSGFVNLGVSGVVKQMAWHMRERYWYGADRRVLLLPKDALAFLVNGVRAELQEEDESIEASTGDIIVAWILKTIYASGTSAKTITQCMNLASFRSLLSTDDPSITQYAHNAFVPLPYPKMTVGELQAQSLPALVRTLVSARASLALPHVFASYRAAESITAFPANPNAHETLVISNVSASRILEADWSLVGAGRTICGYRYQVTPNELVMTNGVYIAGRLDDGTVVLDVSINKKRVDLLAQAVLALAASGERVDDTDTQSAKLRAP